jgi:hypothetical protein
METELTINSASNYEIVRVSKFEEDDLVYFTVYSILKEKYSFWERLKMFFGGQTKTCDLVFYKEDFELLKKF